jgi:ferrochelatase
LSREAVLLLAHGSPEKAGEIDEYLRLVTGGRPLPPSVVEEVKRRYELTGPSPLPELARRQAAALANLLQMPVHLGMRNWRPSIAEAVAQMAAEGVTRAVAICLAPQSAQSSVGLYRKAVQETGAAFPILFVEEWHDAPGLISAFAGHLRAGWAEACREAGSALPAIFTAHSIPRTKSDDGSGYERQARRTAELVRQSVEEVAERRFAFQSQGQSGGAGSSVIWLGPTVEETLDSLAASGHKVVLLQPIGFLCDHVEILYDVDIAFRQYAARLGLRLERPESLNASLPLARAVADLARQGWARLADLSGPV